MSETAPQVKIWQDRVSGKYHLIARNAQDNTVQTDGSPAIGGEGKGVRPMELLLIGLGSCSVIDIVLIMEKQRQKLEDIRVEITAEKHKIEKHSEFKHIHLHYHLVGQIKPNKAERAIELSLDEYCSVAMILKKSAEITHSYSIQPTEE